MMLVMMILIVVVLLLVLLLNRNVEWFDILVPAYPGLLIVKYKFYSELAKINGRFFRVDNFATVTSRRRVMCQKFTNFIQKKNVKLTCE